MHLSPKRKYIQQTYFVFKTKIRVVEDEMHFVILEYIASPLLEKSEYSENNTEYRYIII